MYDLSEKHGQIGQCSTKGLKHGMLSNKKTLLQLLLPIEHWLYDSRDAIAIVSV